MTAWPTVNASAAATPNGANFMTTPVNLNITSATASQNPSIVSFARPRTCDSPIANSTDQKTIWSISLFAAASKKLCGTRCSSTPENVTLPATGAPAAASGDANDTPTPGLRMLTASNPMKRASVVTTSK